MVNDKNRKLAPSTAADLVIEKGIEPHPLCVHVGRSTDAKTARYRAKRGPSQKSGAKHITQTDNCQRFFAGLQYNPRRLGSRRGNDGVAVRDRHGKENMFRLAKVAAWLMFAPYFVTASEC